MGNGFLGTDATLMLDVVVCSLVLVIPTLLFSIATVKFKKNYLLHKRIQVTLGIVLAVVVALFELDMRLQGGFWEISKNSSYAGTDFLRNILYFHLVFSISTPILWAVTILTALKRFPNPPHPDVFSLTHKRLAWASVFDMTATAVTGLMVYYFGFISQGGPGAFIP